MENYISSNAAIFTSVNNTLNTETIVSVTAGKTVTIASGDTSGSITPMAGTGNM